MGKVIRMLGGGGGGADLDMITATAADVRAGKVIVDKEGNPVTGTEPERGNWTGNVAMNGRITIPDGHHGGGGYVNGPAVTQRGAWNGAVGMNAQVAIPEGYHNGAGKVSGPSVPVRGAGTKAVSGGFNDKGLFYYIPNGYWEPDGSGNSWTYLTRQEVANIIGLNGGNIRSGVNYCGVQGSMVDYSYLAQGQVAF